MKPSKKLSQKSLPEDLNPAGLLRGLFDRAVEVADPMRALASYLPKRPVGRVVVVGAGKASARMAEAVEAIWGPCEGLVITCYGYGRPCKRIEIVEAGHPVPDQNGAQATLRMLELLKGLDEDDFVLALISGGGSALLTAPTGNILDSEKQQINAALLASGMPIDKMNIVRKHLSRVKGGQLAAASNPAKMLSLMISDVPKDNPVHIASGPTVGEDSTPAQAFEILNQYGIEIPPSVKTVLAAPTRVIPTGDRMLSRVENQIIVAPAQSLEAASQMAKDQGFDAIILGDDLEGEASDLGAKHADLALKIKRELSASARPVVLISGGECTVTRRGNGSGGPNAEYALALAIALNGVPNIYAIACDTDGVDGTAEVAGALITPATLKMGKLAGCKATDYLARNDSHSFFAKIHAQVVTGPTLTNVNDFRAIVILPPSCSDTSAFNIHLCI